MAISRSIVEAVRSLNPPGRFLDKSPETGLWFDVGHKRAVEKTSQALRDGAALLRKQLSADMGDPEFLNSVFNENPEDEKKDGKGTGKENSSNKGKTPEKVKPVKVRCHNIGARHGFPLLSMFFLTISAFISLRRQGHQASRKDTDGCDRTRPPSKMRWPRLHGVRDTKKSPWMILLATIRLPIMEDIRRRHTLRTLRITILLVMPEVCQTRP